MNVVVAMEYRFDRTPDGAVWTGTAFARPFWDRYLQVFNQVQVVARVREVEAPPQGGKQADGDGVSFLPVPYYVGPKAYLQQRRQIGQTMHDAVGAGDAVILRLGSQVGAALEGTLSLERPRAVEVVGDPHDTFAPGAVRHPLRPFFRWWFTRQLREQCARATAAAYVTEGALQRRYPAADEAYVTHYSSIELPPGAIAARPRSVESFGAPLRLVTVGTLEQLYKAPDVLIDAVGQSHQAGVDLRLTLVGDGKHRAELQARASGLGLSNRVRFLGQLPAGEAVRDELDRADLFVLPSRQEGLPRAMIEAMARGLPCLGSTVGGIPELLPKEDLVPAGDVAALAATIQRVANDPERLARMSARNLVKAADYRDDVLRERRTAFYRVLRDRTDDWIRSNDGVNGR